jgi:hypothetical protein
VLLLPMLGLRLDSSGKLAGVIEGMAALIRPLSLTVADREAMTPHGQR